MRKIIVFLIGVLIFLFICVLVMVSLDKRYISNLEKEILSNTDIKEVIYINKYDGYYIVKDSDYMYFFDSKYEEIYKVEVSMLHENKNNYDLVYRDNTIMYMDSVKNKDGVIFKYYDIYSYELIDEVIVGGSYE